MNPADSPILVLGLQSDVYDVPTLYDEASTVIEQRISQISGVGEVLVVGASLPAVRIELDPEQLASYGISLPAVQQVVAGQNSNSAKGQFSNGDVTADIVANDQISKAADYKPLVVGLPQRRRRSPGGRGRRDRLAADRAAGRIPQRQAVGQHDYFPAAGRQHHHHGGRGESRDAVAASHAFPAGEHIVTILDRTLTIRASVSDIERTLLISVVLVVLVVFLFLRNARARRSSPRSRCRFR